MVKISFSFLIILIATNNSWALSTEASSPSVPQKVTLTQQKVAELVLKQGPKTMEVNLRYQQFRLAPITALSAYDWRLLLESGFEYDKSSGILSSNTTSVNTFERYRTTASLMKPFTTGTVLGLELSRLSQDISVDGLPGANAPAPQQTADVAGFTLEQSLLGNSFGTSDRAIVDAAKLTYRANNIARADDLEGVVLEALRKFWNSYVSQESFREAVNSRDRYKKLVDAVRRKTSLGYSNPGDLPQVQAEFETREQRVKTSSAEYLKNIEDLLTLLALDPRTEINFEIPKDIPAVPNLAPKKPEELRSVKAQKLRLAASENSFSSADSLSYPTLNFVGRIYTTGADDDSEGSYSQLSSGSRPKYYAGLKLAYNFGSDVQNQTVVNRRLDRDLQSTILGRQLQESLNIESQAQRKAEASYAIAISTKRQRDFREKASQELNRSYTQGRTDISILITAMNNFFDSEVQYVRALGDYAISLNEWASVRDELIPEGAPDLEVDVSFGLEEEK